MIDFMKNYNDALKLKSSSQQIVQKLNTRKQYLKNLRQKKLAYMNNLVNKANAIEKLPAVLEETHNIEEPVILEETPVVEEPVVEEPVVEEPVVEEPVVEEPVVEEPVVEEPVVEEPVVLEPVVEEPVVLEPVVEEPVVLEPVVLEPVVEEPVVLEPTTNLEFINVRLHTFNTNNRKKNLASVNVAKKCIKR